MLSHSTSRHSEWPDDRGRSRSDVVIDCAGCPVRGQHCSDCVVTAMLTFDPRELPLDAVERRALSVLSSTGLIDAGEARGARARRDDDVHVDTVPRGWASVS